MAIGGVPCEQGEAELTVLVVIEDIAAEVPALGDVVRAAHGHHASDSCYRPYSGAKGEKFSRDL